ncbi:MAG: hypothetical protein H2B00_05890 [Nitrosopumilaceae archaeon]|uniref:Uncharacterized protein n=2 Tax=Candidatus Nitrosomaritimum aestuariumsis TaxID=3342354 RepID=A0AC60W8L5_9ARCH|nr:hypothetical protein [Nitrosopumilaceae archaeon]MBA4460273.1 hypothetical protein [Nitrosopumilaceae archaeon]MBA4462026.1 hypothetical protein [Nitrosopumilaceae archaeon]MBA4463310.1 hypothetical protein [Nitrosopumilaceae archaeon]NCF21514.1 hypothetical protein [Nitrosopumilaceae archaeon]
MDKYLMVIMIFLIVSLPISFFEPTTGDLRDPPLLILFYGSIAGIFIIIVYSSYKERQERRAANAKRRGKK